ncbi:SGNH/GDSL hydrolase family protein [Gramella sp. AN32]|uniref:SGNH/GDSL hydrolase family protein n=1 Tax=Christiangramia antarctica TaxID=2058158 RepID=A0ABW5X2P3_9FLAO|nr:SGNH/GDSL hydrolase family protein [Gramella sp. AN32]MCM4156950.1 hypothetical protein [Gramella sp. AN32]
MDVDVLEHHPDLVIVMVVTNDMLNSNKMISYELYESNLTKIVNRIKERKSKVLLMAPPPVDTTYLLQRHNRNAFQELPVEKLEKARRIVSRLAQNEEVEFLDLFQIFRDKNLPRHNEYLYFRNEKNNGVPDGVHPTSLGYGFIAKKVFDFLKVNQLVHKEMKIVCFGDSITYGTGVKKGGTANGKSYPAVLSGLLDEQYNHN